jgi:hypothetical protein
MKSLRHLSLLCCLLFVGYAAQAQTSKTSGTTTRSSQNTTTTTGKITITDSNGEVIFEDPDPDATCEAWNQRLNTLDQNSANYWRNNFTCTNGRITFTTAPCLAQWFRSQTFTREQFYQALQNYAANPRMFERQYCKVSSSTTIKPKK